MKHTQPQEHTYPEAFKNFKSSLTVASPGRINLIGEHTDYNMGFVLPTAIDKKIFLDFSANSSRYTCNVFSEDLQPHLQFDLRELKKSPTNWHNYILGVVSEIQKKGRLLKGFDCIIRSDLPPGAGLSSSAALECGMASGLNQLFQLKLSKLEIVELSMRAEHNFVGANCGIMDQFSSVMSRENEFIFLDCRNLEARYIPAELGNYRILLLNSMVTHQLAESEYNIRREQCEQVVKRVRERYPDVDSLRDINSVHLQSCTDLLSATLLDRASYVIEENQRVKEAVAAITAGDLLRFGELMYQSHEGLKTKYEVSCPEIDFLVEFAKKYKIAGARIMGGGFGGCTINLVDAEDLPHFVEEVSKAYLARFNIALKAIPVFPGQGTNISIS